MFAVVCNHLAQLCIAAAHALLVRPDRATGANMTALRRSVPALVQWLSYLAVAVQDEVVALRKYWGKLRVVLAV